MEFSVRLPCLTQHVPMFAVCHPFYAGMPVQAIICGSPLAAMTLFRCARPAVVSRRAGERGVHSPDTRITGVNLNTYAKTHRSSASIRGSRR